MMYIAQKFTQQDVDEYLAQYNFVALDPYVDCETHMRIQCPVGHVTLKTFSYFKKCKYKCEECARLADPKFHHATQEQVEKDFAAAGYTLLDTYTTSTRRMHVVCSKGHEGLKSYTQLKQWPTCKKCADIEKGKRMTHTQEYVEQVFRDNGCQLLDTYRSSYTPMRYICQCGREAKITYAHFSRGERCPDCGRKKSYETRYMFGNAPSSTQQRWLHEVLGGELNYAVDFYYLDIAWPDQKLYLEYDGSGHELSMRLKNISRAEFDRRAFNREEYLKRNDWKEIRIICKDDKLPSTEQIIKMYEFGKSILNDCDVVRYNINQGTVSYGGVEYPYDYGELYRIEKRRPIKQNRIGSVTTARTCSDVCATVGSAG